jgi:hypothetical protein
VVDDKGRRSEEVKLEEIAQKTSKKKGRRD